MWTVAEVLHFVLISCPHQGEEPLGAIHLRGCVVTAVEDMPDCKEPYGLRFWCILSIYLKSPMVFTQKHSMCNDSVIFLVTLVSLLLQVRDGYANKLLLFTFCFLPTLKAEGAAMVKCCYKTQTLIPCILFSTVITQQESLLASQHLCRLCWQIQKELEVLGVTWTEMPWVCSRQGTGRFGQYDLSAELQTWLEINWSESPEGEVCRIHGLFLRERPSSWTHSWNLFVKVP